MNHDTIEVLGSKTMTFELGLTLDLDSNDWEFKPVREWQGVHPDHPRTLRPLPTGRGATYELAIADFGLKLYALDPIIICPFNRIGTPISGGGRSYTRYKASTVFAFLWTNSVISPAPDNFMNFWSANGGVRDIANRREVHA